VVTNIKISIETKTIIRIILVILAFYVGLHVLSTLQTVIKLLIIAMFLALALSPPVGWLSKKMTKGRRALATAISYIAVLIVIGGFLAIVIPPFARETAQFIDKIPEYADELQNGTGFISDLVERYELQDEIQNFAGNLTNVVSDLNGPLLNGIKGVGSFIAQLLTVLVLAFFMLVEGPGWIKHFWETQSKATKQRYEPLVMKMHGAITSYVNGQLLIASIAAVLSLFAMLIVGIPYPLPLAVTVGIFGLIPLIGATLGSIVVIVFALFESAYAALAMLIYFLVYQQIENNTIQPFIQSRATNLSPLLVMVAVLVGVSLGGFLGAFIAIPVASCGKILYDDVHDRRLAKRS